MRNESLSRMEKGFDKSSQLHLKPSEMLSRRIVSKGRYCTILMLTDNRIVC